MYTLDKYRHYFTEKFKGLDKTELDRLIMLNMIIGKLQNQYHVDSPRKVAKILDFNYSYLLKILKGDKPIPKSLIQAICFAGGITKQNLNGLFEDRDVDEYINTKGHLILDGVDYGKIIPNDNKNT